jgi:hypothetical protein
MRRRATISKVVTERKPDDLSVRLNHLAASLDSLAIPASADRGRLGERRDWIVRTIRDYVVPRLENPIAPMTVVFAGPTGAGKSTLLNSVAGAGHSLAGPLRPTTKSPLVLASKALADSYRTIAGIECQVVTGRAPILDELALVDTPDIDSTATEHRAIAETMIDNADIVVYVNSALRYADLVPWEVLRRAHSRGAPVIHVLNRIKSATAGALPAYRARLESEGLGSEVVPIHEHHMSRGAQAVPVLMIQALRDRLVDVVEERLAGRADVVRSVLETMLDHADDVITEAASLRETALEAASRSAPRFDLGRIRTESGPFNDDILDIRPLATVAGSRFWVRRRVRRNLPGSGVVMTSLALMDAWLTGAIDSDIGGHLPMADGSDRELLLAGAHGAVTEAVRQWHTDLDGLQAVTGAIDPLLASALLARTTVRGRDMAGDAALIALTGVEDLDGPVALAQELLESRIVPVYSSVEGEVTAGAGRLIASDTDIYRARTSLSTVTARSTFAHA